MTIEIEEIQTTKCKYCKAELQTELEKEKEVHWECQMDVLEETYKTQPQTVLEVHTPEEKLFLIHMVENMDNIQLYNDLEPTNLILNPLQYCPLPQIRRMIDDIKDQAGDKWGLSYQGMYPAAGIGIRSLRPSDLNSNYGSLGSHWSATTLTSNTFETWFNHIISVNCYIIIFGLFILEHNLNFAENRITEISFKANGMDLPVQNIEVTYTYPNKTVWFDKPFATAPGNNIQARIKSISPLTQNIGLLGVIIGKRLELTHE